MPETPPDLIPLAQIVNPRSIAVLDDAGTFGGRVTHDRIGHGFPGVPLPIDPARAAGDGRPAPAPLRPDAAWTMPWRPAPWPALDADALARPSRPAADPGERLVEMNLDPILPRTAGAGCIAVDARAVPR